MVQSNYNLSGSEILKKLNSSPTGLTDTLVRTKRKEFGKNTLQEPDQKSKISMLLSQFKDVMIILLLLAAVVSFIAGEHLDAVVILVIVIGNAWLGYSQELGADESIKMLQHLTSQDAIVIRNGVSKKLEVSELVPGDIILLSAGDMVPADARLLEMNSLKTEEASLTGESEAIVKQLAPLSSTNLMAASQTNMLFKGTIISNGSAKAVVTSIGQHTEIGKIARLLTIPSQKTPLQKKLIVFSKQLAIIVIIICIIVFVFGILRGEPVFPMFLTALSLAVAALPEALPAVVTIALATGAKRLVKQHALVRQLPAVETLGSVTYICTDKTGTLTQNIMTVEQIRYEPDLKEFLLHAMLLTNEVRYGDKDELLGDPTETALVAYALKNGVSKRKTEALFPLIGQVPFNSARMRMSSLHSYKGKWILFVKGAPKRIVEQLKDSDNATHTQLLQLNKEWASEGLRVLFFAYKILDEKPMIIDDQLETALEFLGRVAMIDPPRVEVVDAIIECKTAGIKTVMITGDQSLTAMAIARRLGIINEDDENLKTGMEINEMTDDVFRNQISDTSVYARVSPEQKLRIVKTLQAQGEFVAMTGDGVNDSPSLKQADIGIAMGITGADVSKQAADMILLDDNFATVVKAVKEGRRIFDNVRNFIIYVLSSNLSEILVIFTAPLLGFHMPLLPIHILWINLVTDGLPGLALVAEPAEKDVMQRTPKSTSENLFTTRVIVKILTTGLLMTISALYLQWWAITNGYDTLTQQTIVFFGLCFLQLLNAISVSAGRHSIFVAKIFANKLLWIIMIVTLMLQFAVVYVPFFHVILKTKSLNWDCFQMILITASVFFTAIESLKLVKKNRKG